MNTTEMKSYINHNSLNERFNLIYENIDLQKERYIELIDLFEDTFHNKEIHLFSTSGRTEICGNHTDHQNGRVLAGAISLDIASVAAKNSNNMIRIQSKGYPIDEIDLSDLNAKDEEKNTSKALIRGIAYKMKELGYEVGGFDAYTASDVLVGSGLSSSAAFEVMVATIINGLFNDEKIPMVELAKMSQFAEREYFKKPSGLMDQTACAVGGLVMIDFKDNHNPIVESIHFDLASHGYKLVIVNTGGSHADLTDDYASVPRDMKKVANILGHDVLRQVNNDTFYKEITSIRNKAGDKALLRAIHFLDENERVLKIYHAVKNNDINEFFKVIKESGKSSYQLLQNIYSDKNPNEQGIAFALCLTEKALGEYGACRVHGGGFAGTIQAFVRECDLEIYIHTMENALGKNCCYVLNFRKCPSMKII